MHKTVSVDHEVNAWVAKIADSIEKYDCRFAHGWKYEKKFNKMKIGFYRPSFTTVPMRLAWYMTLPEVMLYNGVMGAPVERKARAVQVLLVLGK